MPSLALCDSLLDSSDQNVQKYTNSKIIAPLLSADEWSLVLDDKKILLSRYFEFAEENPFFFEALLLILDYKRGGGIDRVSIEGGCTFHEALCRAVSSSRRAKGIVTARPELHSTCSLSDPARLYSAGEIVAEFMRMTEPRHVVTVRDIHVAGQGNVVSLASVITELKTSGSSENQQLGAALEKMRDVVVNTANTATLEQFEAFVQEIQNARPRKGVIASLWEGLTKVAPGLIAIAAAVPKLRELLGL